MKKFVTILFVLLSSLFVIQQAISVQVNILHTSDIHGRITPFDFMDKQDVGGLSRRIKFINTYRKLNKNTIVVDAGDYYQGAVSSMIINEKTLAELLNVANYDAVTFGNHEFDKGQIYLSNYVKSSKTEFISTNLGFSDNFLNNYVKPYKIFEFDNSKILLLAVTTPKLKSLSNADGITIYETQKALKYYIDTVKADKVILISHCGFEIDKLIAQNVSGIDIILGGHDHILKTEKVNNTFITHTGVFGIFLNEVIFDTDNSDVKQKYIEINDEIKSDLKIDKKINKINKNVEKLKKKKIVKLNVELDGRNESLHSKQTNLAHLILKSFANEFDNNFDIILVNSGSIRISKVVRDYIYLSDIYEILPYDNKLVIGTIDGKSLKKAINKGSKAGRQYLQYYSKIKNIDENKNYTIITCDYLQNGGDGYDELKNMKVEKKSNLTIRSVFKNYLLKQKAINERDCNFN